MSSTSSSIPDGASSAALAPAHHARRRGGWVFSASLDLAAFVTLPIGVSLAIVFGLAALGLPLTRVDYYPIHFLLYVCVDLAHQYATPMFTLGFADERRRHRRVYLLAPPLIFSTLLVLNAIDVLLFLRVYACYSVYHFVRQQYGWMMLTARRGGEHDARTHAWDSAAIHAATLSPFAYLLCVSELPGWFVEGDLIALPGAWAPWVLLPGLVINVAYAARLLMRRAQHGVNLAKLLVWLNTLMVWTTAFVLFTDSVWGFAIIIAHHGIPYLFLATRFARRKLATTRVDRSLSTRRLLSFGALALMLALAHFTLETRPELLLATWLEPEHLDALLRYVLYPALGTIGVFHFVVDGFFWKRRHNPDIALL